MKLQRFLLSTASAAGLALALGACHHGSPNGPHRPNGPIGPTSDDAALAANYTCTQGGGPNAGGAILNSGVIHVLDDGTYQWNNDNPDRFGFDPATGIIKFQGPLSDALQAEYTAVNNIPAIDLYFTPSEPGASEPIVVACVSDDPSNAPDDPANPAPPPTIPVAQDNGAFQPVQLQGTTTTQHAGTFPGDQSQTFDLPAGNYTLSWQISTGMNLSGSAQCSLSFGIAGPGNLIYGGSGGTQTGDGSKDVIIRTDLQAHLDTLGDPGCPWTATISAAGG